MDQLSDEEEAPFTFVKRYFAECRMVHALKLLKDDRTPTADIRLIIDGYRKLYEREGRQ